MRHQLNLKFIAIFTQKWTFLYKSKGLRNKLEVHARTLPRSESSDGFAVERWPCGRRTEWILHRRPPPSSESHPTPAPPRL